MTCAFSLSDSQVATIVDRNRGDPKFSSIYYIADEPHTSNCPSAPADVAARTALVHSHDKNAKTFAIVLDGSITGASIRPSPTRPTTLASSPTRATFTTS